MTTFDDVERRLPAWLEQDASGRVDDHLDVVLAVIEAIPQRRLPWSAGRPRQGPSAIARYAAFGAAVLLILAAMLAMIGVGSAWPLPGPKADVPASTDGRTGPAREALEGVMAVTLDHDLYLVDADGSDLRPVVVGSTDEFDVQFSPNGRWLAFIQQDEYLRKRIVLANADGSNIRPASDWKPDRTLLDYAWAPDADQIAVLIREMSGANQAIAGGGVSMVDADATTIRREVDLPDDVSFGSFSFGFQVAWRPQDGGEILLPGSQTGFDQAFYAIGTDGTGFRKIVEANYEYVELSPDGQSLGYYEQTVREPSDTGSARVHLVDIDTGVDRILSSGIGPWDEELHFSPDGATGLMITCTRREHDQCRFVEVMLDGSARAWDIPADVGPTPKERQLLYSPDGRHVIVETADLLRERLPVLIDTASGATTTLDGGYWIQDWGPALR